VVLNVWATWCVPCRKEMPTLDRLQARLGGKDYCARSELQCSAKAAKGSQPQHQAVSEYCRGEERQSHPIE